MIGGCKYVKHTLYSIVLPYHRLFSMLSDDSARSSNMLPCYCTIGVLRIEGIVHSTNISDRLPKCPLDMADQFKLGYKEIDYSVDVIP